jgi:hypothetical protein
MKSIRIATAFAALTVCAVAFSFGGESGSAGKGLKSLPDDVDLRPAIKEFGLGPRAQGKRNTCSVFVTTEVIEFALAQREGRGKLLSVEYLNWACNQVIGNRTEDRGQFFHNLLNGFEKFGLCFEEEMAYTPTFQPELQPDPKAKATGERIRAKDFKIHWIKRWVENSSGLSESELIEVKTAMSKGWPVAAGASHSRLLVAYRDDADLPGGGTFITMDSGSGRYEIVTYEFAKKNVNDAFWVEPAK